MAAGRADVLPKAARVVLVLVLGLLAGWLPVGSADVRSNSTTNGATFKVPEPKTALERSQQVVPEAPGAIGAPGCDVTVELSARSGGGTPVTVSVPADCRCQLRLQVLQRRGQPCSSRRRHCSWRTAQRADSSPAHFLLVVGGHWRAVALCRRHTATRPFTVTGVQPDEWNVVVTSQRRGSDVHVGQVCQQAGGHAASRYFPWLTVSVYAEPEDGGRRRLLQQHTLRYSPAAGGISGHVFRDLPLRADQRCQVDVRPARSWICQGNNDGCQRRWIRPQRIELTEQWKASTASGCLV